MSKTFRPPAGVGRWFPLVQLIPDYNPGWLRHDLVAGVVLAAVLIPVGMGYSEASGLPAINGLYATIAALTAYALMGPSRILIVGPDSSLVPIVAATVIPLSMGNEQHAVALAGGLAILAGILCAAAGTARLGFVTDLLSMPIRVGYLNGIALTLIASQLPKLFGFSGEGALLLELLGNFWGGVTEGRAQWGALAIGMASLTIILVLWRVAPKAPGILIAVAVAMLAAALTDVAATEIELVGRLPRGFPLPALPDLALSDIPTLLGAAAAVAFMAVADSSILSRTWAARDRRRVDPNRELIAVGSSNIASGLFLGMPVSASSTRTPVAAAAGAKTPIAGLTGAAVVAALLIFAPGALSTLPSATLAAVVVAGALRLIDVRRVARLAAARRAELAICLVTTLGVALLGPISGVGVALTLAVLSFLWRGWHPHSAELVRVDGLKGYHDVERHPEGRRIPGLVLFRFDAPLFFANADHFRRRVLALVERSSPKPRWVVITAAPVTDVDATAAAMLSELRVELERRGVSLRFAELKGKVRDRLEPYGLVREIGRSHFYRTTGQAVKSFQREVGEVGPDQDS